MKRNLYIFPAYLVLIRLDFWLPVFFLYFASLFTLERILLLEAVYYVCVVLLEVPSGYFSDKVGRKWTLAVAAAAGAASGLTFAFASDFPAFCAAQFFYAVFMSFNSGSDTALLYDTLKSLGRQEEQLALESSAHAKSLFFGAVAAVAGGAAALWDFRFAYLLSAAAYAAALAAALMFVEPPASGAAPESSLVRQVGACRSRLADPVLKWVFFFYVGRTIFEHIPYEFFQPYLGFVLGGERLALAAGAHLALTKWVSSYFAKRAPGLEWRPETTLLATHAVVTGLILAMGLWLHPVVVVLLLLRNVPHGLGQPVMNARIHPRIESRLRATYFSLQSLAGRLSFAAVLAFLAWWTGEGVRVSPAALSRLCLATAGASVLWLGWLWTSRTDRRKTAA